MRNGVCVPTKSGKWWKFPIVYLKKQKPQKEEDEVERKTATPLSEATVLHTK
ncbi:MAG: hypothetical protein NT161_00900 [Candidatus Nomurabacteria bacterium]|nr:hypothetical protein [Candidatus Nomurabacteria bacterium]